MANWVAGLDLPNLIPSLFFYRSCFGSGELCGARTNFRCLYVVGDLVFGVSVSHVKLVFIERKEEEGKRARPASNESRQSSRNSREPCVREPRRDPDVPDAGPGEGG